MENKINHKWGFGMSPLSIVLEKRFLKAASVLFEFISDSEFNNDEVISSISEVKGLFNRCIRQDQWNWFTVYNMFGYPSYYSMKKIVPKLVELKNALKEDKEIEIIKNELIEYGLIKYLSLYMGKQPFEIFYPNCEFIYLLSSRENPSTLKIGKTKRNVIERVKEINASTGVLYPYSARGIFKVTDCTLAESTIFKELSQYRIRSDRVFFNIQFQSALQIINQLLIDQNLIFKPKFK